MRVIWLGVLGGCGAVETADSPHEVVQPLNNPHTSGLPVDSPRAAASGSGTVVETIDGGGYTYVRLEGCGRETWIAAPPAKVSVGDTVGIRGMEMHDFHSKSLNRTFATILFSRGLEVSRDPVVCGDAALKKRGAASPHAVAATHQGKVLETMESGGYRYAHVDFCGKKSWIAAPAAPVEVGQTIGTSMGSPMHDFHSRTLDRTFPAIEFVRSIKVLNGAPSCP